jgi:hypothetical protein
MEGHLLAFASCDVKFIQKNKYGLNINTIVAHIRKKNTTMWQTLTEISDMAGTLDKVVKLIE